MASHPPSSADVPPLSADTQTWDSLKRAIASSSGFQRWLLERSFEQSSQAAGVDLVHTYLRETLETLAY